MCDFIILINSSEKWWKSTSWDHSRVSSIRSAVNTDSPKRTTHTRMESWSSQIVASCGSHVPKLAFLCRSIEHRRKIRRFYRAQFESRRKRTRNSSTGCLKLTIWQIVSSLWPISSASTLANREKTMSIKSTKNSKRHRHWLNRSCNFSAQRHFWSLIFSRKILILRKTSAKW